MQMTDGAEASVEASGPRAVAAAHARAYLQPAEAPPLQQAGGAGVGSPHEGGGVAVRSGRPGEQQQPVPAADHAQNTGRRVLVLPEAPQVALTPVVDSARKALGLFLRLQLAGDALLVAVLVYVSVVIVKAAVVLSICSTYPGACGIPGYRAAEPATAMPVSHLAMHAGGASRLLQEEPPAQPPQWWQDLFAAYDRDRAALWLAWALWFVLAELAWRPIYVNSRRGLPPLCQGPLASAAACVYHVWVDNATTAAAEAEYAAAEAAQAEAEARFDAAVRELGSRYEAEHGARGVVAQARLVPPYLRQVRQMRAQMVPPLRARATPTPCPRWCCCGALRYTCCRNHRRGHTWGSGLTDAGDLAAWAAIFRLLAMAAGVTMCGLHLSIAAVASPWAQHLEANAAAALTYDASDVRSAAATTASAWSWDVAFLVAIAITQPVLAMWFAALARKLRRLERKCASVAAEYETEDAEAPVDAGEPPARPGAGAAAAAAPYATDTGAVIPEPQPHGLAAAQDSAGAGLPASVPMPMEIEGMSVPLLVRPASAAGVTAAGRGVGKPATL
jgi:hypothetical protein